MPTPRKKPASPAKPTPPSPPPAADPGELAFTKLQPQLAAIAADRLGPPRAEVRAAASFVLSDTVPRLSDPSLRARLLSLPKTEFHHAAIDDLGLCAQALLWAQSRLAQAEAEPSTAKLPLTLVQESVSLRQRMIEVCAYQFRDDAHLQKQVDDIRAGQGYLDLAEDLRRLAALYRSEHAQLIHDQRFYHPGDADTALHLSQRITSELRSPRPDASRESVWRAFALLQSVVHNAWARFAGLHSTMQATARYTSSTIFETLAFPRPEQAALDYLDDLGRDYYDLRIWLQQRLQLGLTKLLNRVYDPAEGCPWVLELRELQTEIDCAVLDCYGWTDIDPPDPSTVPPCMEAADAARPIPLAMTEIVRRLRRLNAKRAREERTG